MKLLPLLGVASLALASACQSQGQYVNKHWTADYVGPSFSRHFLGYNPQMDGEYGAFFGRQMDDIGVTFQRHLFNHNPDNPFQGDGKSASSSSAKSTQKDQSGD